MTSPGSIITTTLTALNALKANQPVVLNDLWKDQVVVLKLLRRFGCPLCRHEAKALSSFKPQFDKLNVRLVAVGFDQPGVKEFIDGKYWDGDLLLDPKKDSYKHFELAKSGIFKGLKSLFTKESREAIKQTRDENITGNLKGDGFQFGGTFVIDKGGKIIYAFRQKTASEYPDLKEILKAVGGDPNWVEKNQTSAPSCSK